MSLPLLPDDPFIPVLRRLVDRNYPEIKPSDDHVIHPKPISFYDRHFDSHLTLKRIRIVPSLHESLADFMEECLDDFVNKGHTFHSSSEEPRILSNPRQPLEQPYSVCLGHAQLFASELVQLATKIVFTPEISDWIPLLLYAPGQPDTPFGMGFVAEGRIVTNTSGTSFLLSMRLLSKLPKAAGAAVLDLDGVFDWFGNWSFYPLTKQGQNAVRLMSSMSNFKWECAHTSGVGMSPSTNAPIPPDSQHGFANTEIERFLHTRRKTTEGKERQTTSSKKPNVKIPAEKKGRQHIVSSRDCIQKAWSTAIRQDTTFLIFNCGSHERIGIRHRASQTLYLSGLIDTVNTKPAYARIQLGLHLAIIKDALSRKDARRKFSEESTVSLKRLAEDFDDNVDLQPMKRSKVERIVPKLLNSSDTYFVSQAEKEMCTRSALLVNLKYGNYHSPSPSCFLRKGTSCVRGSFKDDFVSQPRKKTYKPSEYMTATLRPPIGRGAVGIAHRAIIELLSPTGEKLDHTCLIKLAFTSESRTSLEHEFDIYRHLARKNMVSGIVRVHGLFEDTETDTLALLMDYGGYSLRRREFEEDNEFDQSFVCVDEDEWSIVVKAFEHLHDAGVCHNDVRIDNIVVNGCKEIAIIDFDRASYPALDRECEKEMAVLQETVYCLPSSDSDSLSDDTHESDRT